MSSSWGGNIRISIFGESHGPGIGVVIDAPPAGIALDAGRIAAFMARRRPGQNALSTARSESDTPRVQSGLLDGRTTGTPLCALIVNSDTRSGDYREMQALARPGHADHTGYVRYRGFNDPRGGGHFSGRLTAPLCFAGAVALQILEAQGVAVGAHIAAIAGIEDAAPDPAVVTAAQLAPVSEKPFPVFDDARGEAMRAAILEAKAAGDSVGGLVGCYATGLPAGIGSPMFDGVENAIASLLFGVPAVKGLEFGAGFALAAMRGSEANDAMRAVDGRIVAETNHNGGLLGGITNGMPLHLRCAFKPTPSIGVEQRTVDYRSGRDATLAVRGRHDPCIVPRAVPVVEACVALALLDCMLEGGNPNGYRH